MNKRFLMFVAILIPSLIALTPLLVKVIRAASTDTVVATVTAGLYSVDVTDGTINFGTVSVNSTKSGHEVGVGETQAVINIGTLATKINIGGTDTTSSNIGWTLATTAGADTYTMKSCVSCGGTGPWTTVGIGGAYEELYASLDIGDTLSFDLQIGTPTSTAETSQQSTNVTIQAVSPL